MVNECIHPLTMVVLSFENPLASIRILGFIELELVAYPVVVFFIINPHLNNPVSRNREHCVFVVTAAAVRCRAVS